ncbi:MAG: chorismate mutase [Arcanobacterium sp.]|nr:chorismate mutase [Arcanobacterium sp.]
MKMVDEAHAELLKYRHAIDKCDAELVHIVAQRFAITERVGQLKARVGLPVTDAEREAQQVQRIEELSQEQGLDPEIMLAIWRVMADRVVQRHREIRER